MHSAFSQRIRAQGARLLKAYRKTSRKSPFLTAAVQGCTLCGAADFGAQYLGQKWRILDRYGKPIPSEPIVYDANGDIIEDEEDLEPVVFHWDARRTAIMSSFGFLWYGGPTKCLYFLYDRFLPSGSLKAAACTAVVDVCGHTFFLLIPSFYAYQGFWNGDSIQDTAAKLEAEWGTAAFGMAGFWLPVCAFNFMMVPQHSRIMFVCVCNVINKTWLSIHMNKNRVNATVAATGPVATAAPPVTLAGLGSVAVGGTEVAKRSGEVAKRAFIRSASKARCAFSMA